MDHNAYSNAFSFSVSETDTRLNFFLTGPQLDENGELVEEESETVSRVILPLPVAKELAQKLSAAFQSGDGNNC